MLLFLYFVLELFERFCDIFWHGKADLSSLLVPIKRDANVYSSVPFCCHSLIFLNGFIEVYCMFLAHVFDSKVGHDECEL